MASANGMQIEADAEWQSREWLIQRAMWFAGALLLTAAVAGVFGGGGPLATARLAGSGFTLEYERFDRRDEPSELNFSLESSPEEVVVELDRELAAGIDIERVVPEPDSSALTERGLSMTFTSTGDGSEVISIEYRVDRAGILPIGVSVNGQRADAKSLVYP